MSPGELIDKLTILEIKSARISDADKLRNVRAEWHLLNQAWIASPFAAAEVSAECAALRLVNESLWEIEDELRVRERDARFDAEFIELARRVYYENDRRAAIKRRINAALDADVVEEKSYELEPAP